MAMSNKAIAEHLKLLKKRKDNFKYRIIIDCKNEQDQKSIHDRLQQEGIQCQLLIC